MKRESIKTIYDCPFCGKKINVERASIDGHWKPPRYYFACNGCGEDGIKITAKEIFNKLYFGKE